MFLKKEAEEARKRLLKEKRNLRKQLLETQRQDNGSQSKEITKSESRRGEARIRGRGRWGKRGSHHWTQRYQRKKTVAEEDVSSSGSESDNEESEEGESEMSESSKSLSAEVLKPAAKKDVARDSSSSSPVPQGPRRKLTKTRD